MRSQGFDCTSFAYFVSSSSYLFGKLPKPWENNQNKSKKSQFMSQVSESLQLCRHLCFVFPMVSADKMGVLTCMRSTTLLRKGTFCSFLELCT